MWWQWLLLVLLTALAVVLGAYAWHQTNLSIAAQATEPKE